MNRHLSTNCCISCSAITLLALALTSGCSTRAAQRDIAESNADTGTLSEQGYAAEPQSGASPVPSASATRGRAYAPKFRVAVESPPIAANATREDTSPATSQNGKSRVVVYTAEYQIVVAEIDASISRLKEMALSVDGWLDSVQGNTVTIRVPATAYEQIIAKVEAMGRVDQRSLKARDMTEEYVDLEARLKNAKAVRDRLNALLAKAEDVKAALEVEKELARVGAEIESLEGKLKYLQQLVAYSTITVTFEAVSRSSPTPMSTQLPFPWLRELNPNRLTQTNGMVYRR